MRKNLKGIMWTMIRLTFQIDVYSSSSVLYKSHVPTPQTQVKNLILHINRVTSPLDNSLLFKCKKDRKEHPKIPQNTYQPISWSNHNTENLWITWDCIKYCVICKFYHASHFGDFACFSQLEMTKGFLVISGN